MWQFSHWKENIFLFVKIEGFALSLFQSKKTEIRILFDYTKFDIWSKVIGNLELWLETLLGYFWVFSPLFLFFLVFLVFFFGVFNFLFKFYYLGPNMKMNIDLEFSFHSSILSSSFSSSHPIHCMKLILIKSATKIN